MFARLTLALSLMMVLSLGCKKSMPDVDLSTQEPRVLLLTEQHEPTEVRAAIINAMQTRGWVPENEGPANIIARLSHKGATIKVDLTYAGDRVTITGLVAENAGKGYEKWVGNLEASIRDGLKKPEPVVMSPLVVKPAPTMAVFETKQDPENVKLVLQRALAAHSWVIESDDPVGIVARLNHRKGLVRVRIAYDTNQATINYVDSQELNFDTGGRSDEYEKWMRNLVDSIRASTR